MKRKIALATFTILGLFHSPSLNDQEELSFIETEGDCLIKSA